MRESFVLKFGLNLTQSSQSVVAGRGVSLNPHFTKSLVAWLECAVWGPLTQNVFIFVTRHRRKRLDWAIVKPRPIWNLNHSNRGAWHRQCWFVLRREKDLVHLKKHCFILYKQFKQSLPITARKLFVSYFKFCQICQFLYNCGRLHLILLLVCVTAAFQFLGESLLNNLFFNILHTSSEDILQLIWFNPGIKLLVFFFLSFLFSFFNLLLQLNYLVVVISLQERDVRYYFGLYVFSGQHTSKQNVEKLLKLEILSR